MYRVHKRFRFGGANYRWSNWGLHLDSDLPSMAPPTTWQATRDWLIFLLGALLCGIAFLAIEPWLLSPRGGFGPTVLQASRPAVAIVAMSAALLVSLVIAIGVGILTSSPSKGLVVMGIGLGWLAWRLEGVESIAFSGALKTVAIEGLVWSIVILVIVFTVFLVSGPLRYVLPRTGSEQLDDWATSRSAAIFVACGFCALPVAWIFAQSPLRGQALAAATIGSMAVGVVGRLAAPHAQPVLLVMAPVLAATLAQWTLAFWLPADQLATMYMQGNFPHLLIPVPIDWVAGALMGVPWGIYFGNAFLQHDQGTRAEAEFA